MPAKKTLTIGITVNLDNYENLRLELSGEVESDEDADELAGFLDATLSRLGRGDEATAERVDAYRRRVFLTKPEKKIAEDDAQTVLTPAEEEKVPEHATAPQGVKEEPEVAPAAPAPAPEPAAKPQPAPAPEPPAKKPAATAADVCEECGAAVTKTQKQMSQLFLNKTLCKACMDRLTHPQ